MRVREFEDLVINLLTKADHPEIVSATSCLGEDDNPRKHTRVRVAFASGAIIYIMVGKVLGPNVPQHRQFELPEAVI